jgi:hypothetical protein
MSRPVSGGDRRGDRAQSETLGFALIIGLVFIGVTVVVAFGAVAIDDTERSSETQRAEHTMTVFDSRAALVALGDAERQRISTGIDNGQIEVNTGTGSLSLRHFNYSENGNTEVIYDRQLGEVVYTNGDDEIAYQGGGVWRKGAQGEARLVSPPEFHYRGSTLTLPVIRVVGADDDSGSDGVTATRRTSGTDIYPDHGRTYGGTGSKYANPAENGSMYVKVQSNYYEGWASYFEARTDGEVKTYDSNETARVELVSIGNTGKFDMPENRESLEVRGLDEGGHSLNNFSFTLLSFDTDSANLDNIIWSMWAENGDKQFELHLQKSGSDTIEAIIYYSGDNGDTYHTWRADDAFQIENGDYDGDGRTDAKAFIDFTADTRIEYTDVGSNLEHYSGNDAPDDFESTTTWDQHSSTSVIKDGGTAAESVTFGDGDTSRIDNVTNHYFELMDEGQGFDLTVQDKNSNTVTEGESGGRIQYPGSDRYITYLHVTENEVEVEVD